MLKRFISVAAILFFSTSSTLAAGGKLRSFQLDSSADKVSNDSNWHVDHPKVVIAFGLFEHHLVERYTRFAQGYFQTQLKAINPKLTAEVISQAQGELIVQALKDKDTVGFIFISHTFQTTATQTSVAVTADGYPLPLDILSASTPSLRFAGIFGCHGPGILKEYEVEYEFERLPGYPIFYYNQDQLLSANFLFIDDLKKLLKEVLKSLKGFGTTGLTRGIANDQALEGTLRLRVKDVVPAIEPRFVYFNDRMIGVLGGSAETSNPDLGYEEFAYSIPTMALKTKKPCNLVKISSSQLTPGAIVDDYLIESVAIETPAGKSEKRYEPAWHLGESQTPLPPIPPELSYHGSKSEQLRHHREYLIQATRAYTWMDRNPQVWESSPIQGRFYIDCINMDHEIE